MNYKFRYKIVFIIFLIALVSSIILTLPQKVESKFCGLGEGCNSVQNTKYAYTFGIKNSIYGIFIFSLLAIVSFTHVKKATWIKKKILNVGIFGGSIIALYFLYLQSFIIKEYCKFCLVIDIGMLTSLILISYKN